MPHRLLTLDDVGENTRGFITGAGWNQTDDDWRRLLKLSPKGCFGLDVDGRLAATASTICYGEELAWIGMVLTHPDFRRRGLARALMEQALEHLAQRRVKCIKLDATDLGRPLYEALGFRFECPIQRFVRETSPAVPGHISALGPFDLDEGLDKSAFGADRRALLVELSGIESASLPSGSYAMGRPGTNAAYFGPCVAHSVQDADALLQWFLARHASERVFWDILPENTEAVKLAHENGFTEVRNLARMAFGRSPIIENSAVWAIAGFEYG